MSLLTSMARESHTRVLYIYAPRAQSRVEKMESESVGAKRRYAAQTKIKYRALAPKPLHFYGLSIPRQVSYECLLLNNE